MTIKTLIFFCLSFSLSGLLAQTTNALIRIDFNDCQIQDKGIQNLPVSAQGNPMCVCGLDGDAISLDGINDELQIDQDISQVFNSDFSLSFYVKIDNNGGSVDIISLQKECKRDSSFTIKYIPTIREIRLDIVKNLAKSTQLNFTLDEGSCWQHILIIRDGYDYRAYLNGRLAKQESVSTDYFFAPNARLIIGSSPCAGINNERLAGNVESILVWNRALNDIEIQGLNLFPDKILNNDTTLLIGESLQIEVGPTCSDQFNWTHTTDLDDPFSLEPLITPEKSTVYTLFFQNGTCTSYDSIQIFTLNPEDVACSELLLPNAFSPNGDYLNEYFGISNKFIVDRVKSFDIYDRLGTRVFHGEDKHSSWDGTYQGNYLNPAKFAYVISYFCNDTEFQKQGIVTLIR